MGEKACLFRFLASSELEVFIASRHFADSPRVTGAHVLLNKGVPNPRSITEPFRDKKF